MDQEENIARILSNPELREDVRKITIARLQTMSDTIVLVIEGESFTKQELIEHVQQESDIGKLMMRIQLEYLQALGQGMIYV